jgi:hypothetical protein
MPTTPRSCTSSSTSTRSRACATSARPPRSSSCRAWPASSSSSASRWAAKPSISTTSRRIHFALNCASLSCPRLPKRAFRAETLDAELDRETRRFLAEPQNASVDATRERLRLSSIFDWYESDFVDWMKVARPAEEPSLRGYALLYLPPSRAEALRACTACRVEFARYDWGLNDRQPPEED